jgi:hypothetical protein
MKQDTLREGKELVQNKKVADLAHYKYYPLKTLKNGERMKREKNNTLKHLLWEILNTHGVESRMRMTKKHLKYDRT